MRRPINLMKEPAFVVIIRAIHCRGAEQTEAKEALRARGLWLSDAQQAQSERLQ